MPRSMGYDAKNVWAILPLPVAYFNRFGYSRTYKPFCFLRKYLANLCSVAANPRNIFASDESNLCSNLLFSRTLLLSGTNSSRPRKLSFQRKHYLCTCIWKIDIWETCYVSHYQHSERVTVHWFQSC